MLWSFLKIKEEEIKYFDFSNHHGKIDEKYLKKYNIFYPKFSEISSTRVDACNNNLNDVTAIAKKNHDKTFLLILDQGEHQFDHNSFPKNLHIFNRKFHAAHYNFKLQSPPVPSMIKEKWIYCTLGRADHWRTYFFDLLVEHELHKKNSLSYLCTNFPERIPDAEEYIKTGGKKNQHMIPFNNFEKEIPPGLTNIHSQSYHINYTSMSGCLFGITVETGSTYPFSWYTEKTYNILAGGLIPVIIGGAGAMGQLQNMGFEIPDFLDWQLYDLWPIDQVGMDKLQITIKKLYDFISKNNIKDVAEYWHPYAVKNHHYFLNGFKKKCIEEEKNICKWILILTHNLNNSKYKDLYT